MAGLTGGIAGGGVSLACVVCCEVVAALSVEACGGAVGAGVVLLSATGCVVVAGGVCSCCCTGGFILGLNTGRGTAGFAGGIAAVAASSVVGGIGCGSAGSGACSAGAVCTGGFILGLNTGRGTVGLAGGVAGCITAAAGVVSSSSGGVVACGAVCPCGCTGLIAGLLMAGFPGMVGLATVVGFATGAGIIARWYLRRTGFMRLSFCMVKLFGWICSNSSFQLAHVSGSAF